jgi:tetratricopeptide (TPR) repeat protein
MKRPTTRMVATVAAAMTVLGPLTPAVGQAQPSSSADAERRTRARGYASAGIAAHNRGSYDEAIGLYEKAYAELPHPALFFNMAQAHRLAGRRDQALALYRRYLAEAPDGELGGQARTWIDALEREAGVRPSPTAPATGVPQPALPVPTTATTERTPDRGRGLRLAAYGAGAASLVAFGIGTVYGLEAQDISDELSEPNVVYREARFQDGESAETSMFVWYGVGGALLVGGVVLYVLGQSGDEAPATALVPTVGRDGAGVSWSARF